MASRYSSEEGVQALDRRGCGIRGRVEHGQRRFAAEPGRLALRELPIALRVEVDGLVQGQLAVEVCPALPVADRTERAEGRIPPLAERPRLLDETGGELVVCP